MKANYTVDFFIKKFSAIPARLWTVGAFKRGKKCCALGHCGNNYGSATAMSFALMGHFKILGGEVLGEKITTVNDGEHPKFQQAGPKARILAALKWIKEQAKK